MLCALGPWSVRPLKPNQGLHCIMLWVVSVLVVVAVDLFFFFCFLLRKPFLTLIHPSIILALFVSLLRLSLLPFNPILECAASSRTAMCSILVRSSGRPL